MSLYKDASLVMIPSAYKDGKLYSIRPTDGSGDFTFSRGSNLAATRVDVNGLIEKGRENLLLQSNQFDTTWSASSTSITSGQSGYDGTNDAWLLQATASTSTARLQQAVSLSGVHTTSIYAKAGTTDWIAIQMWSNHFAYFDVANGVVGNSGSAIDTSIEAVGNGFYRCSITYNASSVGTLWVYVTDGNGSTSATSGKNVYLQSAQVERSLVATDYIETGTSAAQSGILEDMPRLDYSGGASCPSLLLEPQRSNVVSQSEYFGDSSWNNSNAVTRSISSISSPEGKLNAYDIIPTTANTNHTLRAPNLSGFTSGAVVNVSFFAKANGYKFISVVGGFGSSSTPAVVFNLDEGAIESGTGTIEDYGSGWYRCVSPITLNATALYCVGTILNDSQSGSFAGDGTSAISVYGFQIEEASYPTSYIPTYGTSQTRSSESSSLTGFDFFPNGEGTAMIEFELDEITISGYPELFRINNPSDATDFVFCYIFEASAGDVRIGYRLDVDNDKKIEASRSIALGTNKMVVRIQRGACTAYLNGVEIPPSQTYNGVADVNMTSLRINAASFIANERIKQFVTFPTALTNAELAAITTI